MSNKLVSAVTNFQFKKSTIKITTLLLIGVLVLNGYGLYWLVVRYSVGTFRHALNYPLDNEIRTVDAAALKNEKCMSEFIETIIKAKYKT